MKKKTKITIIVVLLVVLIIGGVAGVIIYEDLGDEIIENIGSLTEKKSDVKVTPTESKSVQYETFDNGLVSMQIPKGWKVDVASFDYIHYTFMAYNPENPQYKLFFNMKSEGYLKTEEQRKWYANYYPTSPMAILPAIDPQTTEAFYKIFTKAMETNDSSAFTFPTIKSFKVIESIGKNTTGGEIVRATYKDENDKTVDGIFTATIKEVSLYYVTALNVYNTIFFTTPENELTNWESVLNYCVSTIKFSDTFVSGFNGQQEAIMSSIRANQAIYNETSDIITSGWEARQSTYDIISQKQSDTTLGYERVYDTSTGEIYKATNGFMDNDWNGRYEAATDSMYNEPVDGYIEKAN